MKSDFEFAYALFLTDGDYRKMMIDCGVKGLCCTNGNELSNSVK